MWLINRKRSRKKRPKNANVSDKTHLWQAGVAKNMRAVKERMRCERNMCVAKGNACGKRTHVRQTQVHVAKGNACGKRMHVRQTQVHVAEHMYSNMWGNQVQNPKGF